MDTNDERLMEHTEKVVTDMLKYVLAPNEIPPEDTVELVIFDETGVSSAADSAKRIEATDAHSFVFNAPCMKISNPATDNAFNEVLNDIELFLAQGLDKIRSEYPMYAGSTNSFLCNDCLSNSLPPSGDFGLLANTQTPVDSRWLAGNNAAREYSSTFEDNYLNNVSHTRTCIGELWNDEDEWPVVGNLRKRFKRVANESITDIEKDATEEDSSEEDEYIDEALKVLASSPVQDHTKKHYTEYSASNNVPAATTAANPFQLSQTALHQTHSTTTTTTAFGVVHQQTSSSTTTNFVSNNLANAALATTPAGLYTQALLAQQYWTSILKEAQQRQTSLMQNNNCSHNNNNNSNNNNNNNNINAAIYERLAYAQLLQQQILQQQQQAAIAAFLQQQKLALQNNIAAAAVVQAANTTNLFAQAANVIGPSCANTYANFSVASNDYGRASSSSTTPVTAAAAVTMNMNMHMNTNLFADGTKNDIFAYNNNNNQRDGSTCTPTNSNISLGSNFKVADHDERQVACPEIASKVSQSSHD